MSIHEKEDYLFSRWIDYYKSLFCWDGLHRTGKKIKENGYWKLVPDNKEESIWESSPLRCIFLTKDYNHQGDYEGIDIRKEVGRNNITDSIYYPFHRMYLMLLYGIMHKLPFIPIKAHSIGENNVPLTFSDPQFFTWLEMFSSMSDSAEDISQFVDSLLIDENNEEA